MGLRLLAGAVCAALIAFPGVALAQISGAGLPSEVASAGVTQAQWSAVQDEARRQANRAGVSEQALLAAAEATGVRLAASGRFNAMTLQQAVFDALEGQADQIVELQIRLDGLTGDADPDIAALFTQARAALEAGRLREADRLLADISARDLAGLQAADAEIERRRLRAGETISSRGQVAFLQADYLDAVAHFARAAETVPQAATHQRWQYRNRQALSLVERGRLFGESLTLRQAVRIYLDDALPLAPRDRAMIDWAETQDGLGNALRMLGEQGDVAAIHQGIDAFRAALEARARDSAPVNWAATQNNMGAALLRLGERGDNVALEGAIVAFRAALEVFSSDADSSRWSAAQNNLALALMMRSERGDHLALRQAIAAHRTVLEVRSRDIASSAEWGMSQNNLGSALLRLGQRGDDAALREAIDAYRAALEVFTRDAAPAYWATQQNNLGTALQELGRRGDDAVLGEATVAFRAALEVFTRDTAPAHWGMTQHNLGNALGALAERGHDAALGEAAVAFRAALEIRTREAMPAQWAMTQHSLGRVYRMHVLRGDRSYLPVALVTLQAAVSGYEQVGEVDWAADARRLIADLYRR